jgi:ECF sigma factor
MPRDYPSNLTTLLNRMLAGDQEASNQALGAVYTSLKRIASNKLRRERPGHVFDTADRDLHPARHLARRALDQESSS